VRKEGKARFEVPDSSLVGCGTVSTGKSDIPQGNIAYICRIEQLKSNGLYFTKIGKSCLLYEILNTYFQSPKHFPIPSF